MEEIAISKFKATCLAVLERVRKTGQPILVTRFGQVIAEIRPPAQCPVAFWTASSKWRDSWGYRGTDWGRVRLGSRA